MPDDNRFAGLSEAVEDDPDDGSEPADESEVDAEVAGTDGTSASHDSSPGSEAADPSDGAAVELESVHHGGRSDSSPGRGPSPGRPSDGDDESATEESDAVDDATDCEPAADEDPTAFPFDATEKKTVYVRPETLADVEDARALVDAQLRTEHDVRDLTGREFYDAALRLAASDTDGLIEAVLAAREE